jgi:hypothetical protein
MSTHTAYIYDNPGVDMGTGFPVEGQNPFQSVATLGGGIVLEPYIGELWVYSDIDVDLRIIMYFA